MLYSKPNQNKYKQLQNALTQNLIAKYAHTTNAETNAAITQCINKNIAEYMIKKTFNDTSLKQMELAIS